MTTAIVYTGRCLHAGDPAVALYRDEAMELARRHGLDPHRTSQIEYDVVDCALLRFHVYRHNDDGCAYLECWTRTDGADEHIPHDGECRIAMDVVERGLIGELPGWWRP